MSPKKSDENLTKVISSIISAEDFGLLEEYAKVYYNRNLLKLPTISHMSNWIKDIRRREQSFIRKRDSNQPALNKISAGKVKHDQATWREYSKDGY